MQQFSKFLAQLLQKQPHAKALLRGSERFPRVAGTVKFYQTRRGVLTVTEMFGLPTGQGACDSPVFGMHIHQGGRCRVDMTDPFADAQTHYDPFDCPHPYHAGDLPPLFSVNGYAFSAFLSGRFSVREIIGKTVIVHAHPDDFTTQPAGGAGEKMACGEIG